jgi:hypothetical protein
MSAPTVPLIRLKPTVSPNKIQFNWSPPATSGTNPVSSYTLICQATSFTQSFSAGTHVATVSSLTNGIDYSFELNAASISGQSPYAKFRTVQPGTHPASITNLRTRIVTPNNTLISWDFSKGSEEEGKTKWFVISAIPSTQSVSTIKVCSHGYERVRALVTRNFNQYKFIVQAVNDTGYSRPALSSILNTSSPIPLTDTALKLWLDGADPLGSGTAPSNGTIITTWYDKSGNTNNATGYNSPAYNSNELSFNGSDQYFTIPYSGIHRNETCFVVVNFANTSGTQNLLCGNISGSRGFLITSGNLTLNKIGSSSTINAVAPQSGVNVIVEYTLSISTTSIFKTGTSLVSGPGFTPVTESQIIIGTNSQSDGGFLNGTISEFLLYDATLQQTERQKIEGYLAWKWELAASLPSNHPYRFINPNSSITPILLLQAYRYSGTGNWLDESGNNNHATLQTGSASLNGSYNGIVLDGTTAWTFPNVNLGNAWTVSVWFKFKQLGASGPIIIQGSQAGNVALAPTTALTYGFMYNSGGQTPYGSSFTLGTVWTNIVGTWDGLNLKTYINGTLFGSVESGFASSDNSSDYFIGGYSSGAPFITGEIGEVRIYSYPIMQAKVTADYQSSYYTFYPPVPQSSLYMWLDATKPLLDDAILSNGAAMTTWYDRSSQNNNAIASGSPTYIYNSLNSLPGVRLNNIASLTQYFKALVSSGTFNLATVFFIVWKSDPASTAGAFIGRGTEDDAVAPGNVGNPNITDNVIIVKTGNAYRSWTTEFSSFQTSPTFMYISVDQKANELNIWGNGTQKTVTPNYNPASLTPLTNDPFDTVFIGTQGDFATRFSGVFYEILAYNSLPTLTERQRNEGYLAWKWGLQASLPSNHPYSTIQPNKPPVVFFRALDYSCSGPWLDKSSNQNAASIETGNIAVNMDFNGIVLDGTTNWAFLNVAVKNSWTASVWYKKTGEDVRDGNYPACILTQGLFNGNSLFIGRNESTSPITGGFFTIVSAEKTGVAIQLTTNAWVNIQVTWDGTNMRTYINGSLLGTTTPGGEAVDSGQLYRIGRRWDIVSPASYVVGEIGEVRIYDYPLSQKEVTADYNESAPDYLPRLLVNLTASSLNAQTGVWGDQSGNGKNAFLEGGTVAVNAEANGVILDGSTYWSFPNVQLGNAWTASVWYKQTGAPTGANACILVQEINSNYMNFMMYNTGTCAIYPDGVNGPTVSLTTGVWTNIVSTWDGTYLSTYINGTLLGTTTPGVPAVDSGQKYRIGRMWDGEQYVIGEIGEVKIWKNPLTANQISHLYTKTLPTYQVQTLVYLTATSANVTTTAGSELWLDKSGNVNNATLENGTAALNAAGNGVVLNGSSNWAFPNYTSETGRWSVNMWYKSTSASNPNSALLTQIYDTNARLGIYIISNNLYVGFITSGGPQQGTNFTLTLNAWANIQATYDNNTLKTYVNNIYLGAVTLGSGSTSSNEPYRIGLTWDELGTDFVTGEVGEVRIFDQALTANQLTLLYNSSAANYLPITGMNLWLDGADPLNGTAISNGSSVTTWYDKSGNLNNATTTSNTALYATNQGISFDTTTHFALPDNSFPYGSPIPAHSIYSVVTFSDSSNRFVYSANDLIALRNTGSFTFYAQIGTSSLTSISSVTADQPVLFNVNYSRAPIANNLRCFVNGTFDQGTSATNVGDIANTPNFIGTNAANTVKMSGTVREILVFSGDHSKIQRQTIEGYLAWKWGLQAALPNNHPYYARSTIQPVMITSKITGVTLWLDASDPEATGTPLASGTPLTTWYDKSGNNNDAVITGTITISKVSPSVYYSADFSASSFATSSIASDTFINALEYFVVYKSTSAVTYNTLLTRPMTTIFCYDAYNFNRIIPANVGDLQGFISNYNLYNNSSSIYSTQIDQVKNSFSEFSNGVSTGKYTAEAAWTPEDNGTSLYIGTRFDLNTGFMGSMQEIVVFNRALSTTERQNIEGYLAWKWGLQTTLPSTHPYYASAPINIVITA